MRLQTGIWGRRSSGSASGWGSSRRNICGCLPDYAAAVWRLEGMLGRGLNEALDEAAFITAYAALGLPGKVEKVKGVP